MHFIIHKAENVSLFSVNFHLIVLIHIREITLYFPHLFTFSDHLLNPQIFIQCLLSQSWGLFALRPILPLLYIPDWLCLLEKALFSCEGWLIGIGSWISCLLLGGSACDTYRRLEGGWKRCRGIPPPSFSLC